MKNPNECKRCGNALCDLCDDTERRVCIFCMDNEHRNLWYARIAELREADANRRYGTKTD